MRIVAFVASPLIHDEKEVHCHFNKLLIVSFQFEFGLEFVFNYVCTIFSFQLVKLAKRLKKEKVNVDIINFGEEVLKFL